MAKHENETTFDTQEILAEEYREDTAIVKPEAASHGIAADGFFNGIAAKVNEQGYYASFDTTNDEGRTALFNSTNSCVLLRDYMNQPIEVAEIVFASTDITDEAGELQTVMGVYLIDTNGTSYVSSSTGVIKSVARMVSMLGEPSTWSAPKTVICKETNTAKGRRYKFLELA